MSLEATVWAWNQSANLPVDKLVLLALADFAGDDESCWPSRDVLAARCGITTRTLAGALQRLIDRKLIDRKQRRPAAASRFRILR